MHRQRLFELTTRWFAGQLEDHDGTFLSQLFVYERLLVEPPLRRLLRELTAKASEQAPSFQGLDSKDGLRALLAADPRTRQDAVGQKLYNGSSRPPRSTFRSRRPIWSWRCAPRPMGCG